MLSLLLLLFLLVVIFHLFEYLFCFSYFSGEELPLGYCFVIDRSVFNCKSINVDDTGFVGVYLFSIQFCFCVLV